MMNLEPNSDLVNSKLLTRPRQKIFRIFNWSYFAFISHAKDEKWNGEGFEGMFDFNCFINFSRVDIPYKYFPKRDCRGENETFFK